LLAGLALVASLELVACPLCMGAFQTTTADKLANMHRAVLAVPGSDGSYRVIEVIKGERPANGIIAGDAVQLIVPAGGPTKPLLLLAEGGGRMWVGAGGIGAKHASWLRKIAAGKRSLDMNAEEWQARVALMLPYLENSEPLVAEIAYNEFAAAPYASLLTVK